MTEEQQIKEWMKWYCEKPINVREVYGDAFEWTEQEKQLLRRLQNEY